MNARLWRKVSRTDKQLLEQEGRKSGDEKWTAWTRERRDWLRCGRDLVERRWSRFVRQRWCSLDRNKPGPAVNSGTYM